MQEQIQCFGQHQNLYGILAKPDQKTNKPCILIINAGAVHKTGPFNLHVHFARYLAEHGYSSFRFDLSGQGDSLKVPSAKPHHEQVLEDMKAALDCLEQHFQIQEVISFGLCTGAENAHKIAVNDKRITGLIWLDGYGYETPKFKRLKLIKKLSRPFSLLKKFPPQLFGDIYQEKQQVVHSNLDNIDDFTWKLPTKDRYREDMSILQARKAHCLYIYSGGVQSYYNYQGQMADAFEGEGFTQFIEEAYFPKADHTFFIMFDRLQLFKRIATWLEQ